MKKVYLVRTKLMYNDGTKSFIINGIFTNKEKAKSLLRYYKAWDILESKKENQAYKAYRFVEEWKIEDFDFTHAAIALEEQITNKGRL